MRILALYPCSGSELWRAISEMPSIQIYEKDCRTAISKSGLPEIDYSVNPYHGCLHGCVYCFAVDFTPEKEVSENWGNAVYVRRNIHEVLKKEIVRMKKGVVALSTITDPYQSLEARYRLSRKCAEVILRNGFFLTVQTKSPLVTIDMDLWKLHRNSMDIGMTITTPDERTAGIIEPGTPPPASRFRALKKLHEEKIPTWIFLGPVIPGVNDSIKDLKTIVKWAAESGSRIIYDRYNPYKGASVLMSHALGKERYSDILKELRGKWWEELSSELSEICGEESVPIVTQQDDWLFERNQKQRDLTQF